ncbi:MAG: hypothetical protein SGPRY_011560, partial [Prymnesium sp.]
MRTKLIASSYTGRFDIHDGCLFCKDCKCAVPKPRESALETKPPTLRAAENHLRTQPHQEKIVDLILAQKDARLNDFLSETTTHEHVKRKLKIGSLLENRSPKEPTWKYFADVLDEHPPMNGRVILERFSIMWKFVKKSLDLDDARFRRCLEAVEQMKANTCHALAEYCRSLTAEQEDVIICLKEIHQPAVRKHISKKCLVALKERSALALPGNCSSSPREERLRPAGQLAPLPPPHPSQQVPAIRIAPNLSHSLYVMPPNSGKQGHVGLPAPSNTCPSQRNPHSGSPPLTLTHQHTSQEEPVVSAEQYKGCELHGVDLVRTIMECISLSQEGCDRLERAQFELGELLNSRDKYTEKYLKEEDMSNFRDWRNGSLNLASQLSDPSRDDLQRCAVEYAVYQYLRDRECESMCDLSDHHAVSCCRPEDVKLVQQSTRFRIRLAEAASDADLLPDNKTLRERKRALEQQLRNRLLPELQQSIRVVSLTHSPLVMGCEWSRPAGCTLELPEEMANICEEFAGLRVLGMEGSRAGPRVDGFTFRLKIVGSLGLGSHLQRLTMSPAHEAHYKSKQLLDKRIDFRLARDETNPQQGPSPSLAARPEQRLHEPTYIDQSFEGNEAIYGNGLAFCTPDGTERWKAMGPMSFLRPEQSSMSDTIPPVTNHANAKQNHLADCWLMSAVLLLDHRKNEVISRGSNGQWSVILCRDGEWLVLQVDERLPHMMHGPKPTLAFANGDLWVSLVEKAVAKMYMSYASLESGSTDEALETLTGFPTTRMMLQGAKAMSGPHFREDKALHDKLWKELVSALRAGFLCTATVDGSNTVKAKKMRLVPEHAYSLIGVDEGKRDVILLNPLGEYRGHANLSMPQRVLRNLDGHKRASHVEGYVVKSFDDFVHSFAFVDVCRVQPDWWVARTKGFLHPLTSTQWEAADAYELDLAVASEVELSLIQCNGRGKPNFRPTDLCILLLRRTNRDSPLELVAWSDRLLKPSVHLITKLDAGSYVAFPLTFGSTATRHGSDRSYVFRIGSSVEFIRCHQTCLSVSEVANAIGLHVKRNGVLYLRFEDRIKVYELRDMCGGLLYMENHSNEFFMVDVDLSENLEIHSSRGELCSRDVLPPANAQLLHALTKDSAKATPR